MPAIWAVVLACLWLAVVVLLVIASWGGRRARVFSLPAHPGDLPHLQADPISEGPWVGTAGAVLIDRRLLVKIADPAELRQASSHHDRVVMLQGQISADGLRQPIRLNIDQRGRLCIADGHHRLVVANRLKAQRVPVVMAEVEQIRGWSVPAAPFFISSLLTSSRP